MSKVLIVSKTKMANDNVCVGGVDIENERSVRLLDENGYHELRDECPYEIWDVWETDYCSSNQRPAPHVEDVNVLCMQFCVRPQESKTVVVQEEYMPR